MLQLLMIDDCCLAGAVTHGIMSFPLFVEKIEDLMLIDVLPTLIP